MGHTGNHQGQTHWEREVHARPPANANQTESGAGQIILQCRQKSPQTTPRSRLRDKGMQTRTGQVLDGSSRGLSTASICQLTAQANQGMGKVPKPIPASLRDAPSKKLGKALSRTTSRQNRVRDEVSHWRKQQTVRSHVVHWWFSHQKAVRVRLHCQGRCDYLPPMKTVQPIRAQLPAWQWRGKQSPMLSAGLPQEVTDHTFHTPHRFNELAAKSEKWNRKPRLERVDDRHPPWKSPRVYCPGHAGVKGNDGWDWLAGKATLTRGLLLGRSEVLRSLRYYLPAQTPRDIPSIACRREAWKEEELDDISWKDKREGHRQ